MGIIDELDSPELRSAFAREVAELNRRRLRVIGLIMLAVHVAHVCVFWVWAGQRAPLPDGAPLALHDLMIVHGIMIPLTATGMVVVFSRRPAWLAARMGPLVTTMYLVHGALCTVMNLFAMQSVTTYVAYCLGMAVILCIAPRSAAIAYGIGLASFVASLAWLLPSKVVFLATLPTCATTTAVGGALASLLYSGRRREFRQRVTIERQRDELGTLNRELAQRVEAQVGEIVVRAREIEQLNAQLQTQVRVRSSELAAALARLARQSERGDAMLCGRLLGERFRVGEIIGEGGMGAVYEGVDELTGARIAIKVVQATSTRSLDALRRFAREAGTAAAVAHPAVVRMLDIAVSEDGLLFQVQQRVDGAPLTRAMSRAWRPEDAARLGAVLCDALAAAHAVGVVHRDVTPANILLTARAPGLTLVDFGIAKLYAAVHGHDADDLTGTARIVGTPAYMAPEQVLGGEMSDRTDIYAVGVILFRLVSERHPFEAELARETMMKRLVDAVPNVRAFQPSVPEPLARWIDRCLARASERPAAAELARQLAAWADAAGAPRLECIVVAGNDAATLSRAGERDGAAATMRA